MSGQRWVKYSRPTTENEDAGAVCGAWAARAGSATDSPSAFVLLGRDDDDAGRAISVREYNFDSDTLLDTVRPSFPSLASPCYFSAMHWKFANAAPALETTPGLVSLFH